MKDVFARTPRAAWALLSSLAILAVSPATAQPTPIPSTFFGVSALKASDYPQVTLGTLAHGDFAWVKIEKSKGTFDFSVFDADVAAAQANALVDTTTNTANMAITLAAGTPGWAVSDQSSCSTSNGLTSCTAPPDNIQDWKDFLTALVQHYNGTTQPHIRYYELWNEFNVNLWWTGTDAQLVALARAAYPIVHQDPYSQLLTPSVAGPVGTASPRSSVTHMTSYLQAGGAAYADGGAFHGYLGAQNGVSPFPMPEDDGTPGCTPFVTCYGSIVTKATQMRAVFDQYGLLGKPMYQTEGSWGNNTVTDPDTQVAWIARFTLLQAGLRASLNLQLAAWFSWSQASFGWGSIEAASGSPTTAGVAYTEVYHWLVGATMPQPCSSASNGTWTCSLTRPGGYIGQAVWNTKGSLSYTPGPGYTQYRDLAGGTTAIPPGGSVTVGAKPILVEGSNVAPPGAPNIVMVLTDDQDVQLGTLDYMPNVKALLINQGTLFSNYLVPLSLCCPSRSSILRGQFPHNTRVVGNSLPDGGFEKAFLNNIEASTLATVLHGAGYRTVLLGKYLNGYPDSAPTNYIPPGWDEWYSPVNGNPYAEYGYQLNENGTPVSYHSAASDYLTDVIYGKAVDFIQRAAGTPNQPIFIYFATYAPHSPYTPAPRHANLFPGLTAPKPPSFNEADVSDKPNYINGRPLLSASDITTIDSDYRLRIQALQAVDEAVAGLINTLASTGRLSNTYFVFASDNGYHMGEHRLGEGKYTPYETDIHVPLVIRGPGVPAGVVQSRFTANLDLAETFADLAGLPPLEFSDGRSLKPLLALTPPPTWRQAFLLEQFDQASGVPTSATPPSADVTAARADPESSAGLREPPDPDDLLFASSLTSPIIPSFYGYRTTGYKYIEYHDGEKELYVDSDPYELTNVASKIGSSLAASLSAYLNTLKGCKADGCRSAEAVSPPPLLTASFTVAPSAPVSGSAVTLTATASGTAPYTFAWTIDGAPQSGASLVLNLAAGSHSVKLDVLDAIGAEAVVTQTVTVTPPPQSLLLSQSRVQVTVQWQNPYSGQSGTAYALPQNDQFGFLYYSDPNNPEVFVKVLDFGSGSALCFVGGLTDFYYKVTFTMLRTGQVLTFVKPAYQYVGFVDATTLRFAGAPGTPAESNAGPGGMTFVGALSTGDATPTPKAAPVASGAAAAVFPQAAAPQSLAFSSGRVSVTVDWRNPYSGESGRAYGIPKADPYGFFYYSDPNNPEVFVKVLDFGSGTALCFVGGLTDFYYKVTFTVVRTGQTLVFEKPEKQYVGFVDATTLKF